MDFVEIANQFVKFYYSQFDGPDRSALAGLYRDNSMLTFESSNHLGVSTIIEKLMGLPFGKVEHRADTIDAQPSIMEGGILVLVTGVLMVDEEKRPMNYVQTFHLLPADGSFYVFNDMFKLVYNS